MEDKVGHYWLKQGDEWVIAKHSKNPFEPSESVWHIVGDDNDWDLPPGEVGPFIEPPEWVVEFPGGTTHGPFTETEALVYAAKQYPGSGCKVKKSCERI